MQGSLLQCKAVAELRQLPHRCHATAAELEAEYPMNAKQGYQGLFEAGAGAIKVGVLFECSTSIIRLYTVIELSTRPRARMQ